VFYTDQIKPEMFAVHSQGGKFAPDLSSAGLIGDNKPIQMDGQLIKKTLNKSPLFHWEREYRDLVRASLNTDLT
jgi:hypothetical protein